MPSEVIKIGNFKAKRINSLTKLKKLANRKAGDGDWLECFIMLNFGRSSKRIFYNKKGDYWDVNHEIDDTFSGIIYGTKKFIKKESFIIDAMKKKALYQYIWD